MNNIAIVAGGNISSKFLSQIQKHQLIIGADRGAWWLIGKGIVPEYAIGDFDSVSKIELEKIKHTSPNVVQYKEEKNETDLELAISFARSLKPGSISVFGGIGTRLDQTMASIFLLEKFKDSNITFFDKTNIVFLIRHDKVVQKMEEFPYCSFLPLTSTATVSLEGFKYPLKRGKLYRKKTIGVSNEIVAETGNIIVHKGMVIAIQSQG